MPHHERSDIPPGVKDQIQKLVDPGYGMKAEEVDQFLQMQGIPPDTFIDVEMSSSGGKSRTATVTVHDFCVEDRFKASHGSINERVIEIVATVGDSYRRSDWFDWNLAGGGGIVSGANRFADSASQFIGRDYRTPEQYVPGTHSPFADSLRRGIKAGEIDGDSIIHTSYMFRAKDSEGSFRDRIEVIRQTNDYIDDFIQRHPGWTVQDVIEYNKALSPDAGRLLDGLCNREDMGTFRYVLTDQVVIYLPPPAVAARLEREGLAGKR